MNNIQNETFYNKVIELFQNAKKNLSTAVNMTMVYSYYEAGRMIVEEEQGGKERAAYGKYILKELSQRLTQKFGRGYSYDNLKLMRKFYLVYSKDSIGETPFPQSEKLPVTQEGRKFYLSWSHYLILMRINNVDERHFYEIESYRNGWNKDELARQYGSSLYERLALSRDKEEVLRLATEGQMIEKPEDIFKDPYILEFTGLPELVTYSETELENKIIDNLQKFLLELGRGFTIVEKENVGRDSLIQELQSYEEDYKIFVDSMCKEVRENFNTRKFIFSALEFMICRYYSYLPRIRKG